MNSHLTLRPNQKILFIGDSITDAGRLEKPYRPLGYGYVHFIANWLIAKYPQYNLEIINTGINGNSILDLKRRWERDCLKHKPDIISVLIGINDVCRQYNDSLSNSAPLDKYEVTYKQLLSAVKEYLNCELVLIEPFLFCDDTDNAAYKTLMHYIQCVHTVSKNFDAVTVELQKQIDETLKKVPAQKWSDDMVHPYLWAHAWIARRWLEVTKLL